MYNTPISILQEKYRSFQSCIRFYEIFHVSFISFLCLQLLAFLLFFSYFSKSLIAACGLALFFLTLFSYFVLLFFFQAKKPQQFSAIQLQLLSFIPEEDTFLRSQILEEFEHFIAAKEVIFYRSSCLISALAPMLQKFNIWMHWKHFQQMKEILLEESVQHLNSLVKKTPTSLEVHGKLAETYTKLCKLYLAPKKLPWISPEYSSLAMKRNFQLYSQKAIEEFKILEDLSDQDPWVVAGLAEIYRLQQKAEEEIFQCEKLLELTPNNSDVLLQLGILYFQKGHASKGLKIYELLQRDDVNKAQELIDYYN
jgi:tetratricopeptide (TPR) repeat protein